MIRNKDKPALSMALFNLSFVCVILALIGALGYDLYLASTQWILVALVLALWSVYMKS